MWRGVLPGSHNPGCVGCVCPRAWGYQQPLGWGDGHLGGCTPPPSPAVLAVRCGTPMAHHLHFRRSKFNMWIERISASRGLLWGPALAVRQWDGLMQGLAALPWDRPWHSGAFPSKTAFNGFLPELRSCGCGMWADRDHRNLGVPAVPPGPPPSLLPAIPASCRRQWDKLGQAHSSPPGTSCPFQWKQANLLLCQKRVLVWNFSFCSKQTIHHLCSSCVRSAREVSRDASTVGKR